MKHPTKLALILVFAPLPVYANWTPADTAWQVAFLAVSEIDRRQTLKIADHPEKWRELNPILGEHPSRKEVNRYFLGTALIHTGISIYLSPDKRRVWQVGTTFGRGIVVIHNGNLGL